MQELGVTRRPELVLGLRQGPLANMASYSAPHRIENSSSLRQASDDPVSVCPWFPRFPGTWSRQVPIPMRQDAVPASDTVWEAR